MSHVELVLDGKYPCLVTRCGYTGEDGFEISVPNTQVVDLTAKLLQNPEVRMAGLGPRDSLRIEAALNLYGQEITETTSPIAAGLTWCIGLSEASGPAVLMDGRQASSRAGWIPGRREDPGRAQGWTCHEAGWSHHSGPTSTHARAHL